MKALFVGVVGTPERPGEPFKITPEGAASLEASRSLRELKEAGLRSLLGLGPETKVQANALNRRGKRDGLVVPEAGALVISAAWHEGENHREQRIWVDDTCRIDEEVTRAFGAEAEFRARHGIVLEEDLANEMAESARRADIETTRHLRDRELARVALEAA